jgi:hypothetical protein
MMKNNPVVCAQISIDVMGRADANQKRIRFVADILGDCIRVY